MTYRRVGNKSPDCWPDYQLYWGIFHLDESLTTHSIMVRIYLQESNNGVNVIITEVMLSHGEGLPNWTGQQVSSAISYTPPSGGAPTPPGRFKDQDGNAHGYLPME